MNRPTVSVVITTVNRSESVLLAIRSVFAQTYCEYDLHVIDDGSTDRTPEVVKQILDGRENAFYWRHERRRGLCAARNTGITKSNGEFIVFLDDDDMLKSNSLEKRIAVVKKLNSDDLQTVGVIYSGCEVHIPHENRITYNLPRIQGNIADSIRAKGLSTIPSTGMHPRTALEKIGGFDGSLISSVDHDLWMALAKHGFYAFPIYEPLTITYNHKQRKSMVTDTRPRIQGVEQYLEKWRPVYQSWYGMCGGQKYIQAYRTRVLGALSAKKLTVGEWREAWRLLKHVLWHNRKSSIECLRLSYLIIWALARKCLPVSIIVFVRSRKWCK